MFRVCHIYPMQDVRCGATTADRSKRRSILRRHDILYALSIPHLINKPILSYFFCSTTVAPSHLILLISGLHHLAPCALRISHLTSRLSGNNVKAHCQPSLRAPFVLRHRPPHTCLLPVSTSWRDYASLNRAVPIKFSENLAKGGLLRGLWVVRMASESSLHFALRPNDR